MLSLLELRNTSLGPESLRELVNIITYEVGDLNKAAVFMDVKVRDDRDYRAYRAEASAALMDIILQSRLLAEALGFDYDTLSADGEERFRERMEEVAEIRRQKEAMAG